MAEVNSKKRLDNEAGLMKEKYGNHLEMYILVRKALFTKYFYW